jgi:ribosomal protein S8E
MLVFKNKTAAIRILSSKIADIEAIKSRKSFKMRIAGILEHPRNYCTIAVILVHRGFFAHHNINN